MPCCVTLFRNSESSPDGNSGSEAIAARLIPLKNASTENRSSLPNVPTANNPTRTRLLGLAMLARVAFGLTYAAVKAVRFVKEGPPAEVLRGMVWIPGGEFTMGSDAADACGDEKPGHRAFVEGFWMDASEVTNAEFRRFVESTGYTTTADASPCGRTCRSSFRRARQNRRMTRSFWAPWRSRHLRKRSH